MIEHPSNNVRPNLTTNIFLWIAVVSGLILMIPAMLMQITELVTWQPIDFIVMGILLFCTGSGLLLIKQKVKTGFRLPVLLCLLVFNCCLWVELLGDLVPI